MDSMTADFLKGGPTMPRPRRALAYLCVLIGAGVLSANVGAAPPEAACCVGGECYVVTQAVCDEMGGFWVPHLNTCDVYPYPCPWIGVCCIDEMHVHVTQEECEAMGGEWHPFWGCEPEPCLFGVCCLGDLCYIYRRGECDDQQGEFHWEWDSCEPNPCAPTSERSSSWGEVKRLYRKDAQP
jgi:hypothetical protein